MKATLFVLALVAAAAIGYALRTPYRAEAANACLCGDD